MDLYISTKTFYIFSQKIFYLFTNQKIFINILYYKIDRCLAYLQSNKKLYHYRVKLYIKSNITTYFLIIMLHSHAFHEFDIRQTVHTNALVVSFMIQDKSGNANSNANACASDWSFNERASHCQLLCLLINDKIMN